MEVSVTASLGHLHTFIQPQIIITDHASREDRFFIKSIRSKAIEIGRSVIELPPDASENLMWFTRLDSGSLAGEKDPSPMLTGSKSFHLAWHTTYVDIVIHAPPESSGSLIRLIKSIEAADYFGSRRPHITIELPAEVDPPTLDFLENIVWPPIDRSGEPHASQVTLRHRLPRYGFTTAEASTHFIESFYPARPKNSHVLLLSPQIELSPVYFHYTMYNLLEYKYSNYGHQGRDSKNLMGFSLELPSLYLNNSAKLVPPTIGSAQNIDESTPFLWQAPNCNAALYFGDKWIELHSFLSSRISGQDPDLPDDQSPTARQKVVSEYYPAWMEYVQELMRVREYSLLYPNFPESKDAIVAVHNELHRPPEEYKSSRPLSSSTPVPTLNPKDLFIVDPSAHSSNLPAGPESPLLTSSLISLLPNSGDLPELPELPILSFDGNVLSESLSESTAHNFASDFRREIGRCNSKHKVVIEDMSADDLFCNFGSSEEISDSEMSSEKESDQEDEDEDEDEDDIIQELEDEQKAERKPRKSLKAPVETSDNKSERKAKGFSEDVDSEKKKDKAVSQIPLADKSKMAQNEFTEHLKRQGVKTAGGESKNEMSTKQVMQDETSKLTPHVSDKGLMKERNRAFEVVNGNLVKKEKKIDEDLKKIESKAETSPSDVAKPTKNEQDEDNGNGEDDLAKESSTEVKKKSPKPAEDKAIESSTTDHVQSEKTEVSEAATEDKVVTTQETPSIPKETKPAAVERNPGW